jgi:hypothetical protein
MIKDKIKFTFSPFFIILIVFFMTFPLAYSLTHSVVDITIKYALILSAIPCFFALFLYIKHQADKQEFYLFHPILFGILIGYLLYFLIALCLLNPFFYNLIINQGTYEAFNIGLISPQLLLLFLFIPHAINKDEYHILLLFFLYLCLLLSYIYVDIVFFDKTIPFPSALISVFMGFCITFSAMFICFFFFRERVKTFFVIGGYIKTMTKPVAAFFLGYFIIVLFFAGIHASIAVINEAAFSLKSTNKFFDFFFYSYCTLTGFIESGIKPLTRTAIMVSIFENFLGLVWVTVVFAATIGYLQESFSALSKKFKETSSRVK